MPLDARKLPSSPCRPADRHRGRRPRRPVAGPRPEAGRSATALDVDVVDPALRRDPRATAAPPRSRPRRGACSSGSASGTASTRRGAADPRHGRHRQPPQRPGPAGLPDLRRRGRAGRALRPYGREAARSRPLLHGRRGPPASASRHRRRVGGFVAGASRAIEAALDGGASLEAALLVAADGAARACARTPASAGSAGPTGSPASSPPSRTSATTRAAPSSISCRPAPSPSCRSRRAGRSATAPRSSGRSAARLCRPPRARPEDALAELERRFGLQLGESRSRRDPQAYPLALASPAASCAERFALLGDAAHVIHPIAGQGLNLGLHDAAALAESIVDAVRLGLDPGGADVLAAYERARRFDTVAMGDGDGRAQPPVLERCRCRSASSATSASASSTACPALKRFFIREAAGLTGATPRLMQGEAL